MQRQTTHVARVSQTFSCGDQVKVTTELLCVKDACSQKPKLQPRHVGPFTVLGEVNVDAYRSELPGYYNAVHNVFHASGLRPGLERDSARTLAHTFSLSACTPCFEQGGPST
jgi:hypothetical protein